METHAVVLAGPEKISLCSLRLTEKAPDDIIVETRYSGISTGTEKLFWTGDMPPFPGMGYPLVPGYEAVGEVVEAPSGQGLSVGDHVFVPGATCYQDARGLFGAASKRIFTSADRLTKIDPAFGAQGVLLALAATAHHAITAPNATLPDLIIGHGILGRLLARLTIALGAPAPITHEINPERAQGAQGYQVVHPEQDSRRDYRAIYDASGHGAGLDGLIGRLIRGGEVVLAGFYAAPLQFSFAPAFMREARLRIAAEWSPEDMVAVRRLLEAGVLSFDGLLTHQESASDAPRAYTTAFGDNQCLKMILDWRTVS